jgi:hypothetical protein
MKTYLKQSEFTVFALISFIFMACKVGYSQPPPSEIMRYVDEYHRLLREKKEEIRRSEELDRQSREAMEAGKPEKTLDLLKKAIAILRGDPNRTAAQTPEVTPTNDSPFGLHPAIVIPPSEYGINNPYDFAVDLGVAWDRSLRFIWTLTQPDVAKEEFRWIHDRQLHDAPNDVHLLANILIGIPETDSKYYQYAREKSFLPKNVTAYTRFVKAVVERYDGDGINDMPGLRAPIKYWQVDNEPPHGLTDYAEFLKITYRTIKEADPEAKVIIGGVPGMPPVSTYLEAFDKFYLPILDELAKSRETSFDIFDFHWYGNASGDYRGIQDIYKKIKQKIDERDLSPDCVCWMTEMGTYSGDPIPIPALGNFDYPFQTEEQQASDLLKRYVFALSLGIKKVFNAFGLKEGFKYDNGFFDFTGLIYDGRLLHDKGKGVKKLAYYTYKLMTEKLQGSDWDNIAMIKTGNDNVYAYRFPKKASDKFLFVVWWDYFHEKGYHEGDIKKLYLPFNEDSARVTSCLSDSSGKRKSWETITSSGKIEILLGKAPLFVETAN